jgi:p-methyltransferase
LTPAQLADEFVLIDPAADSEIDAFVVSEGGEETLAAIARRTREGDDFRSLPNLAIPEAGGFRFTSEEPEPSDLDNETVDWGRYLDRIGPFDAPIRSAVGCPFKCEFCDFTKLYKPALRSIDSLVREIRTLGGEPEAPRNVFFTDDNLALNRKRLFDLTTALIEEQSHISWRAFIRADAVDAETARMMRASGCRECFLGIESGDPDVLRNMNKRLDPDHALRAVESLDENGINTQCTFVVGFPGECARSIERTAALISAFPSGQNAKALQRYYVFRFQVWPLCPAASNAGRARFKLRGVGEHWEHATMDAEGAREAVRELFLSVRGPSHTYIELVPPDWPVAATRSVMETRDEVQKRLLKGAGGDAVERLLDVVREAEENRAGARA